MREMRMYLLTVFLALSLAFGLAACGGEEEPATPTPAPAGEAAVQTPAPEEEEIVPTPTPVAEEQTALKILEATFAHGLTEEFAPVNPGNTFTPEETIYLSIKLKGTPKGGQVTARFLYQDQEIASATVDLAEERKKQGLVFVIGGNTNVGFTLTHEKPFPISDLYRAEILLNGSPAGSYEFIIIPPPEAIPSQVRQAVLARGATEDFQPIEPTDTFTPTEEVFVVGRVDLGLHSTLEAHWYVSGQLDEAGTRTITAQENVEDTGFYFSYLPEQGWPEGEHKVVLLIDDREVATYTFTVRAEVEPPTPTPAPEGASGWSEFGDPYDPNSLFTIRYPAHLSVVEENADENQYGYIFSNPEDTEALAISFIPVDSQPLDDATWSEMVDAIIPEVVATIGDDAEIISQAAPEGGRVAVAYAISEAEQRGGMISLQEDRGIILLRFWLVPKDRWEQRLQQWQELEITWFPPRVHKKFNMWTPYEEPLGFFSFSRPPQLDQEEELTDPPTGYAFKSDQTGEGLLFVYSDVTDADLAEIFQQFVQELRKRAFGESPAAETDTSEDAQGLPVTITEFTSEDGTRKGLEVLWEPQQGIRAYFLWMAPADLWNEGYHEGTVLRVLRSLRWSPERIREYYDRRYLSSTSQPESTVEQEITSLTLPEGTRPLDLAWDPAGRWVAMVLWDSSSGTSRLALYDGRTFEQLAVQPIQASKIAFSPDGTLLATAYTADLQDHLTVWETAALLKGDAAPTATFRDSFGGIMGLAFSPDGRLIALAVSAAQGSLVPVIEAKTGSVVQKLRFPYEGVHAPIVEGVAFGPDGAYLVAIAYGGTVQIWRTEDWEPVATVKTGISGDPNTLLFLDPGGFLTNGSTDEGYALHIWRVDGTLAASIPAPESIHTLALSSGGQLVVALGSSEAYVVISGEQGLELLPVGGPFQGLVFSPDDQWIAVTTQENQAIVCPAGYLVFSLCG
ncbi:MAG: hypothetical protein GXP39_00945 [Chloroflexi bacterium]|nr:hypothetical protein [Chloroflexota bacterium]